MRRFRAAVITVAVTIAGVIFVPVEPASAAITSRGIASTAVYASQSTTEIVIAAPSGAVAGDLLVASVGYGRNSGTSLPMLSSPPDWTPVSQVNRSTKDALAVFTHVYASGESSYAWHTDVPVAAVAFVAAFAGVGTAVPVDAWSVVDNSRKGASVTVGSVTTTATGDQLVAVYYGYRGKGSSSTWTAPSAMSELGDAVEPDGRRSGSINAAIQDALGPSGAKTATASAPQDYTLGALVALRPANEELERVGLSSRADHFPDEMSGGEMQRVAIARALVIQPEAVLCDEPTGNLDSANSQEILKLLRSLPQEGQRAVVMVTHDPCAAGFGDRTIHLRDGLIESECSARSWKKHAIAL